MRWRWRRPVGEGPLVLDVQRSAVRVEGDDPIAMAAVTARVAVVAHWSIDRQVGRSTSELIRSLLGHGYQVVLVSAAEGDEPLAWPDSCPSQVSVLRRPNIGYDFGSWATALDRYPAIAASPCVLFLNDSLVGPFQPFDQLLERFHDSAADVWGLTDTSQYRHHLQSYCLGFRGGVLREAPLAAFWRGIRQERSRDDVIWRYEIGLSRLLDHERFVAEAAIPYRRVVRDGQNPTILGWRRLLDEGFPFVKRQLLREPHVAADATRVPEELRRRFGVDVEDWL
jgi:lipopolysaccharide biosynthesis protein